MEAPFSNREIVEKFDEIKDSLKRIEQQTTKTNGRVTKLEGWRWIVVGGGIVAWAIVAPLSVYIFQIKLQEVQITIANVKEAINQLKH